MFHINYKQKKLSHPKQPIHSYLVSHYANSSMHSYQNNSYQLSKQEDLAQAVSMDFPANEYAGRSYEEQTPMQKANRIKTFACLLKEKILYLQPHDDADVLHDSQGHLNPLPVFLQRY